MVLQCPSKQINFNKTIVIQLIICVIIIILVSGFTNPSLSLLSINAFLTSRNTANYGNNGSYRRRATKYNFLPNETIHKFVDPSNMSQTISPQFNLVTIVTEFFVFDASKDYGRHNLDAYAKWINTFLKYIINPVVIYTDMNNIYIESIFNYRLNHNLTTMIIKTNFTQIPFYKQYYNIYSQEFHNKTQHMRLKPTRRDNPNVCIAWQLKYIFTNEIANTNPFQSKYFFWFDIGTWRLKVSRKIISKSVEYYNNNSNSNSNSLWGATTNKNKNKNRNKNKTELDGKILWPDPSIVEKSFIKCKDCLLIANVFQPNKKFVLNKKYNGFTTCINHTENLISGTWFGGTKNAINWLYNEYFSTHEYFFNKNMFVGNDQHILNFLFFNQTQYDNNLLLLNSIGDGVAQIPSNNNSVGCSVYKWFYYQLYFANDNVFTKLHQACKNIGRTVRLRSYWPYRNGEPFCVDAENS